MINPFEYICGEVIASQSLVFEAGTSGNTETFCCIPQRSREWQSLAKGWVWRTAGSAVGMSSLTVGRCESRLGQEEGVLS